MSTNTEKAASQTDPQSVLSRAGVDADGSSSKEAATSVRDGTTNSDTESGPAPNNAPILDRGIDAWRTIAGAWFIQFATFGYLYSFGVYQDFYTRQYLTHFSPSKIAWIGSFQMMMPFLLGIVSGRLFDAGYFHMIEIAGATIFTFSLFMLSLAKPQQYYQMFLSQGVGMGLGLGLTFVPTTMICVHHFRRRRALATGIIMTGTSLGAVVFPIMINNLIQKHSFGDSVRASGYLVLGFVIIGNLLVKAAYQNMPPKGPPPNIKGFLADPPYLWTVLGALTSTASAYFPLVYLQLYGIQHQVDPTLSFYSIAILNGVGIFGRLAATHLADLYGAFNVFVPCTLICGGTIFAVFGVQDRASLIVVSIMYGIFSSAYTSLALAALASLARHPAETGARAGLALALSSFGSLGAAPIQGALLTSDFHWNRPIIFSGVLMAASSVIFAVVRMLLVRERKTQKV